MKHGKNREAIQGIRFHLQTHDVRIAVYGSEAFHSQLREALDPSELERVTFYTPENSPYAVVPWASEPLAYFDESADLPKDFDR